MDNYAHLKGQNKHKRKCFPSTGNQEHFQPYTLTSQGPSLLNQNSMLLPRIQLTGKGTAYEQLTSLPGAGNYGNHTLTPNTFYIIPARMKMNTGNPTVALLPTAPLGSSRHRQQTHRSGFTRRAPVLAPCGCCNKRPPCEWLKTPQIYYLTVLEDRSPNIVLLGEKQGVGRAAFPLDTRGESSFSSF